MRATARSRRWASAPQVFELTALVAAVLLAILESRTPWEISYTLPLWAVPGSLLLVDAPLAALRSVWLGNLLVLPRFMTGVAIGSAWPWTAYAALITVAVCASWRRARVAWLVAGAAVAQPIAVIAHRGRMMTPGGGLWSSGYRGWREAPRG